MWIHELDGPTFLSREELEQYREWLELTRAGS
jgi:hypothetical protein